MAEADCICGLPTSAHVENTVSTVGTQLVYRTVVVSPTARCRALTGGGIRWAGVTKPLPAGLEPGMAWEGGSKGWRQAVEKLRRERAERAALEKKKAETAAKEPPPVPKCPICNGSGKMEEWSEATLHRLPCHRCEGTGLDFKIEVYAKEGGCPKCTKREPPTGRAVPGAPITKMIPFRECEACGTAWLEKPEKKEAS